MRWYETNPHRLEAERQLLQRYYPGSIILLEHGRARVEYKYRTSKTNYLIKAEYPDEYPYSYMHVNIVRPPVKGSPPHYFSGGGLCLHDSNGVGPETTAKVYLDWTTQWIQIYEKWLVTGEWPETNRGLNLTRKKHARRTCHF